MNSSTLPYFLSVDEVLYLHKAEVARSGGIAALRDSNLLDAAVAAPQASFGGVFLMKVFDMAATYINSIVFNHPFLDGNKRTALLSSLVFLHYNGFNCDEKYEKELADQVLGLITHKYQKDDIGEFFRSRCYRIK